MIIQIPGVDSEKGLDLYEDDYDLYIKVLHSYVSNTPLALDKLRKVSAETLADYASVIHGVKGTSTAIGAEDTRKEAYKLELLAKASDLSGVLAGNDAFLRQADKVIDNINVWLKKIDAKR